MRYAIVASLIIVSTVTRVALAQDGIGHGPPKRASVVFVSTQTTTTQSNLSSLFKPKSILAPTK